MKTGWYYPLTINWEEGRKTGFWLEEFAAPYFVFIDAGHVTLASGERRITSRCSHSRLRCWAVVQRYAAELSDRRSQ